MNDKTRELIAENNRLIAENNRLIAERDELRTKLDAALKLLSDIGARTYTAKNSASTSLYV